MTKQLIPAFTIFAIASCCSPGNAQQDLPPSNQSTAYHLVIPADAVIRTAAGTAAFSSGKDYLLTEYPAVIFLVDKNWQRMAYVVTKVTEIADQQGKKIGFTRIRAGDPISIDYATDNMGHKIAKSIKLTP